MPIPFMMNYNQKLIKDTTHSFRKIDNIQLNNGDKVFIQTQYLCGEKFTKLLSLRDKLGNWIKSILRYYSNGKVYKEYKSYNRLV
jgi:hypothetical protein